MAVGSSAAAAAATAAGAVKGGKPATRQERGWGGDTRGGTGNEHTLVGGERRSRFGGVCRGDSVIV